MPSSPIAFDLPPHDLKRARRFAVQCLYGQDLKAQLFPDAAGWEQFCLRFQVAADLEPFARWLSQGALEEVQSIDQAIEAHSKNWKLHRIARVDLAILRICAFELLHRPQVPPAVVIADASEMGKLYGGSLSGGFLHGVLDGIVKGQPHVPDSPAEGTHGNGSPQ